MHWSVNTLNCPPLILPNAYIPRRKGFTSTRQCDASFYSHFTFLSHHKLTISKMKLVLFALVYNLPNALVLTTKCEERAKLLSVLVADSDDIKLIRRQKCECVNLIIYHLPKNLLPNMKFFLTMCWRSP